LVIKTEPVEITEEIRSSLVQIGNYTHPLFSDLTVAKNSNMNSLPLPGQALLLLAGGAVENSGELDNAIALLELVETSFSKPAFAGDSITVEISKLDRKVTSDGEKSVDTFSWTILNQNGDLLAKTTVKMLMRVD
jgi:acyl dehydratase